MPKVSETLADKIQAKAQENMALFDKRKTGEKGVYNLSDAELKTMRDNEAELGTLNTALTSALEVERAEDAAKKALERVNAPEYKASLPGGKASDNLDASEGRYSPEALEAERVYRALMGMPPAGKSVGRLFVESKTFKEYNKAAPTATPQTEMEVKTVFDTSTGYAPQAIRIGRMEQYPTRPPAVIDILPQGNTDQVAIVYMEETTFTNNSAETSESGAYPEAALAFTERSSSVRKIAVFLPITDEMMQDVSFMEAYVNQRLQFMIKQRLDSQLLVGDGSAPNLRGGLNVSGINTQALGSDPAPDALYKGFNKIRSVGFAEPTTLIIHPNDWQDIRLLRTAQGVYLFGSPYEPGFDRVFGVPTLSTTAITEGSPFAGDFQGYSMWFWKKDLAVSMGYVNDDFKKGQVSIRAELRGALVYFRPLAFCKYTGF